MHKKTIIITISSILLHLCVTAQPIPKFDQNIASEFASMALDCVKKEYPNKISHVLNNASDVATPSTLHPAFYGCFDWHSSVHGHWLLVKILKTFPEIDQKENIISVLTENLSKENIEGEIKYFKSKGRESFERPYGWSWFLKLCTELYTWDNPVGKKLYQNLSPLSTIIKEHYYSYLPGLYYPLRRGVHENTAFGLMFALDYAESTGDDQFQLFLKDRAKTYFQNDTDIPAKWEPDGDDFFSPSLIEADLMRRVLSRQDFVKWYKNYLPQLPYNLLYPAVVADRNDPKGVHLDGLNLSRAWCMFELAKALPDESKAHQELWQAGYRHAADALPNVMSDNYVGSHWLATFAVYMYSTLENVNRQF